MLTKQDALALNSYIRATNYLTVAQIFLKDNFLLARPLVSDDIKPRLLGHWGSCPGVNVIYAHLSLINKKRKNKDNLFIPNIRISFVKVEYGILVFYIFMAN